MESVRRSQSVERIVTLNACPYQWAFNHSTTNKAATGKATKFNTA
jgi:hypothetical protein